MPDKTRSTNIDFPGLLSSDVELGCKRADERVHERQHDQAKHAKEHEPQQSDHAVRLDAREMVGQPLRQKADRDPAAVQRRQREQVQHHQHGIDDDAALRHQQQWFGEIVGRNTVHGFDHESPEDRHQQIGTRSGSGDPEHVAFGIAQPAEVDRYRLCPAERIFAPAGDQYQYRNDDRAHGIDVPDRIERDAPRLIRRQVAEMPGGISVRRFVQGNREYAGNRVQRDEADGVLQFHHAGTPNAAVLPLPRLTTTGISPVRSTTVVISTPHDPPSSITSTSCSSRYRISSMSFNGNSSPGSISVELNSGSPISSSNARTTL